MRNFVQHNGRTVNLNQFSSVVADHAAPSTSDRYAFIPTTRALGVLADFGWQPTRVSEARANKAENRGFQKHLIRLQHPQFSTNPDSRPEICLFNSHDTKSAFVLMAGVYEMVCANGLIVQTESFGKYRVLHKGYADEKVAVALTNITTELPRVLEMREEMGKWKLTFSEQVEFAREALPIRFNAEEVRVRPESLIHVRHHEQRERTLWNTFNVVQENMVQGGISTFNRGRDRFRRAKALTSVTEDIRVNSELWSLAERTLNRMRGTQLAMAELS